MKKRAARKVDANKNPRQPKVTNNEKTVPAEMSMQCGLGSLEKRKGIFIVHLRGDYREMGRQHAEMAKAVCGDVALQYFNRLIENLVAHSLPPAAGAVGHTLKWLFHKRNKSRLGERMTAHLGAFAEVFGYSNTEAERIFFVPDIIHYLIGRAFPAFATPPCCSAFFAAGEMTKNGRVVIGRNFDFFGRGIWNTNNAAIVMHPKGGQSFCWLGALSVPGSAQGFNESGLFIGLHTQFTRDVQIAGQPVFKICHDVLADCRTLDDAIRLVQAHPRMAGLTLFVADTKNRTSASIGFTANHVEIVRPENDLLVQTNHYRTAELQEYSIVPYPWQRNTKGRRRRLLELLDTRRGELSAADVPAILGDCWDVYENRKRVAGNIVACINNSQSIVMSPDEDKIWIAAGDYPVCHAGQFSGFRISALLNGKNDDSPADDLPGGRQLNNIEREALFEYEEAWSAHMDHLNNDRAVFHLRRAAALLPEETIFPRMAGILLLTQKKYRQALPLLLRNLEYDYRDKLMKAEALIWVGRCLDLMKRHDEACKYYSQADALSIAPVSPAAHRHMEKPFRTRHLFDISPEFIVGTAMAKY